MKRVLSLILMLLFSILAVGTGTVKADEQTGYVLIQLNNDGYYFDSEAINNVDFSFNGIGEYTAYLVDNKTLKIETPTLEDFLKLFAPPGYSTSSGASAPAKTVFDEILDRLNYVGSVKDASLNATVTVTLSDIVLMSTYPYSSVKVTVLGQETYYGEDYTVTVDVQGTVYLLGWRNNRGTILLDGMDISGNFHPNPYTVVALNSGTHTIETETSNTQGCGYTAIAFSVIGLDNDYTVSGKLEHNNYEVTYTLLPITHTVTFNLKDALTGQSLSDVTVKEGDIVLGTIDDGGSLELTKGTHTLTFEKSSYWSVTKTIDVQSDMSVSVEMYPSSAAFKFLNFPSSIEVYENSIYELTFTISPITTDATYNTYLSISGLNNVLEVKKAGQVITPENGKYYLGDISEDTQISIKFKAGSIGTHSFTVTLTSNDAIMSSTYTTSKQVAYNVIPLPFSVQMPSEWQVGANELRISESSGQTLLITAILKDSQGNEVWSDSASLGPYEAYTFQVNVPSEGTYTLELQFNGQTASWDITVSPAISLLTKTITASEGDIATIQVKLKNPSSNTKYYTIVLEGPIIEGNVSKSVSVAPLSEKTVDVSFQVPSELEYDAYDLNVKVYEGDALQYSDIVHLVIDNSGFSLPFFGGGSSIDSTWLWLGAGVLALFVIVATLRRR